MKKILILVAVLLGTATGFAQGYNAPVRVVVQNRTPFIVNFAPRYHLAFFDGNNDHTFFGVQHDLLGWLTPPDPALQPYHRDFNYQQEGLFEPALGPGQTRTYYNSSQAGYPFVPNGGYSTFNTTDTNASVMEGYQINPVFIQKYMRLDWIRFSMTTTSLAGVYAGGLAHPVPSGFNTIASVPAYTGGGAIFPYEGLAAVGPYNEMIMPYWPSTLTFTYGSSTYHIVWTATTYVPGQVQTVNILFY
ncbi:hypothetical protein [Flavobacterium subsaxonicum]|uniref:Uncharacterized protein n=1 Tax=Flavobacterium subsaxonicum WB 4.1-42 = DSM 21790 TaxID=1121898 RepID=A0A0A2MJ40_9FLAO|nr:hypothetical protein [Flavobacterium subsaxonicum]KGO92627.1 hypothetical protein Q766_10905 [Flavobacterium subsaxonicum WB 4.1-42 = DSM 21790]